MQRPQHEHPGKHQPCRFALGGLDQMPAGILPVCQAVLRFRKLLDVARGILEGDELSAVRKWNRIIEAVRPSQCRDPSLSKAILTPAGIRGAAPSSVLLQIGQGAPAPPQLHACGPSQGISG